MRALPLLLLIAGLALGGCSGGKHAPAGDADADALHGAPPAKALPAPTFTALNYNGEPRGAADLVGHPTVLWFFPAAGTYG